MARLRVEVKLKAPCGGKRRNHHMQLPKNHCGGIRRLQVLGHPLTLPWPLTNAATRYWQIKGVAVTPSVGQGCEGRSP